MPPIGAKCRGRGAGWVTPYPDRSVRVSRCGARTRAPRSNDTNLNQFHLAQSVFLRLPVRRPARIDRMSQYTTDLSWSRNGTDFAGKRYSRGHQIAFDGGITIAASSSV